jgi:3-methyladenine DNA glycosylase/8-oxoguanine DNA glycosylase
MSDEPRPAPAFDGRSRDWPGRDACLLMLGGTWDSGAATRRLVYAVVAAVVVMPIVAAGQRTRDDLAAAVRRILNLDEDLSVLFARREDPGLSWTAAGAGRMGRTPTVFEAVVKTN